MLGATIYIAMGRTARHTRVLKNAEAAFMAAIEIYNKPAFAYREETFSILLLNAWELLLKSKILADNGDRLSSLFVRETRKLASGKRSKKEYLKRNRAKNPMTVSVQEAIARLNKAQLQVPQALNDNLDALVAVRDNAIHYLNASAPLAKLVYEIGTASVRNFVEASKKWFALDLGKYPLYLMPIAFIVPQPSALAAVSASGEKNLLSYLSQLVVSGVDNPDPYYHVALEVKLAVQKVSPGSAALVAISNSPDAVPIMLSEEDIRQRFPWDYAELLKRIKAKYVDFKANKKFNQILKPLSSLPQYVNTRLLDPGNPRSSRKRFYNPNIISEFDKHYTAKP